MDPYRSKPGLCPTCGFGLRTFERRRICDGCGGMLIGREDLQQALQDQGVLELEVSTTGDTKASCPVCGEGLKQGKVVAEKRELDVEVSACASHGIWFDGGGLVAAIEEVGRYAGPRGAGGSPGPGTAGMGAANAYVHSAPQVAYFNQGVWGGTSNYLRPVKHKPTVHTPPPTAHVGKKLACPKCQGTLARSGAAWICTDHGAFIEDTALDAMIGEMTGLPWEHPKWGGELGARACPACATPMTVEHIQGIEVDRCASDGIWLDPGELEQILSRSSAAGRRSWIDRLFRR